MDFDNTNQSISGVNAENNTAAVNEAVSQAADIPAQEAVQPVQPVQTAQPIQPVQPSAGAVQYAEKPVDTNAAVLGAEPVQANANEYIHNNVTPPQPKKSNAGKITLGVIASLLAVFVVSVTSISAYIALSDKGLTSNPPPSQDGGNNIIITPGAPETKNGDTAQTNGSADGNAVADEPEKEKVYPTLEQLASPEDALGLPEIYEKVAPSVVGVSCVTARGTATGTGIIISKDGYIITNAHVIDNQQSVTIVDRDFNEYEAAVVGYDTQTDLAVLKIEAEGLTPCEFGSSGDLKIGELTVVIGNPLGFELYGTMTNGIISGLNRTITIGDKKMTLIQTNASINQGNSGGPLINAYGQIIGVTSAKVASIYGEGLGFAIPIDEALPIIDDLMKNGYVTGRPEFGFSGEDITNILSLYYNLPKGVLVRFIEPDSGAYNAGIKAGDIVIGFNGEPVRTMDELNSLKNNFSAGDTVTLTVYRDGKNVDIDVTLGEAKRKQNR